MARKRRSKPTGGRRRHKQRVRDRFAHAHDDAVLAGVLPMRPGSPEETLKPERVDPSVQGSQPLPSIAIMAIAGERDGSWKVPPAKVPLLVDEMVGLVESQGEDSPPAVVKVMAFNALAKGEQLQYERDNPEAAGKAKGGTNVAVGVGVNVRQNVFGDLRELLERAREQRDGSVRANEGGDDSSGSAGLGSSGPASVVKSAVSNLQGGVELDR